MSIIKEVKIKNRYFQIVKDEYANGNIALLLIKRSTQQLHLTLTINVSDKLPKGCVPIKDYSENAGMLDLLIQNDVIGQPLYYVQQGFVSVPICNLKTN